MASTLLTLSLLASSAFAAPSAADPCAAIAGKQYVQPSAALACLRSFPTNETLKTNVLSVVRGALDEFSFEAQQIRSPHPFEESSVNLRRELARIQSTRYRTDYDFNRDLYQVVHNLNDGHTLWLPQCYWREFLNIVPAPVVSVQKNGRNGVYIADDSAEFLTGYGPGFVAYFQSIGFNWQQYAGARVLEIAGSDPYSYLDFVAKYLTGNYLDHGIRVNGALTYYRFLSGRWSQAIGALAGIPFPEGETLRFKLIKANSTKIETVNFPFVTRYIGTLNFTDGASYWANNCKAKPTTNGVDYSSGEGERKPPNKLKPVGSLEPVGAGSSPVISLPASRQPTAEVLAGNDVLQAYVLPNSNVAVLMVGSFSPADYSGFQQVVLDALAAFKAKGATKLIIDVTSNGGGYVCLGYYLHQALVGTNFGYGGFQTSLRASSLARQVVAGYIKRGLNAFYGFYPSDNWAFLNGTQMPALYNYIEPPVPESFNGFSQPRSQKFLDICEPFDHPAPAEPYFDAKNIIIVGNGNCGSTCAQFATVMKERHNVRVAVFGGKPGTGIQYKGLAGSQVLEWANLDSEFKTSGIKPGNGTAPPDLLVDANIRINWRTAYSWKNLNQAIAFRDDQPNYQIPYTSDIVLNPQNLWNYVASKYL